jgi:hypothetical protein
MDAYGRLGPNCVIQFNADKLPECADSRHSRQVRLPPLYGGLELDVGSGRAVIPPDAKLTQWRSSNGLVDLSAIACKLRERLLAKQKRNARHVIGRHLLVN